MSRLQWEDKDPYIPYDPQPTYPYNVEEGNTNGYGDIPIEGDHEEAIVQKSRIHRWLKKLFDHGVEARGIERVPEDERDGTHTIGLLLLWWSVNSVVSTVPIGVSPAASLPASLLILVSQLLAQAFFSLSFKSAVAAIVSFTAIGAACCGFIATLGPKTGLRTMVISRYSVGFVGATIFAIFNILTQLVSEWSRQTVGEPGHKRYLLTSLRDSRAPLSSSAVKH